MAIPLGPFDVTRSIGRGGMGQVWHGTHRADGTPVAIKVLHGRFAEETRFHAAFRNEVRAVASLDHPHIVGVYDYGAVDALAAENSRDELTEHCPYIVMELVPGGTLSRRAGGAQWPEIRDVLLSLLDALAHAHARGVVHRDLKPTNVLLDKIGTVKLTDFGLAHAVEELGDGEPFQAGTPAYMAPEQFDGRWRDYGPWTDLYALGCLTYTLIQGGPPFGTTRTWEGKCHAHRHTPPPELRSNVPLPEQFRAWLMMLLAKDVSRRYRRAADAAADLLLLGDPDGIPTNPIAGDVIPGHGEDTLVLPILGDAITILRKESKPDTLILSKDGAPIDPQTTLTLTGTTPSRLVIPGHWQREAPTSQIRLHGAGMGLFGLRTIPLVDRDGERDGLWSALRRSQAEKRAVFVLLRGPTGTGKSRLAEWLSQRSHEIGAAINLRAPHGAVPGPGQGLSAMIESLLRCFGMSRAKVALRVGEIVGENTDEAEAITQIIRPSRRGREFKNAAERYAVIARMLRKMSSERAIVIWLDDVHWGLDALRFVSWLLDRQDEEPLPVLVVATAVDEELSRRPDESKLVEDLRDRSVSIEVGALPEKHRAALIRQLLGLAHDLAGQIETRTAGNPLFAIQLVGDWIQRGLLVPGPRGFQLKSDVRADLPEDLNAVWVDRVERVLAHASFAQACSLEIAAVLGQEVDAAEWREACTHANARTSGALMDHLLDQRLIRPVGGGIGVSWSFAHGLLREALESRARSGRRLVAHHQACATTLAGRIRVDGSYPEGLAERIGRHLLGAGKIVQALEPLLLGAEERTRGGEYGAAEGLLADREAAMQEIALDGSQGRWGEGWLLRARLSRARGDYDGIASWLDRIDRAVHQHGWPRLSVWSGALRGGLHRLRGNMPAAVAKLTEVEADAVEFGDRAILGEVRWHLGEALTASGSFDDAQATLEAAKEDCAAVGDDAGAAHAFQGLAELAKERGHHTEAVELLAQARDRHQLAGNRWGVASATNSIGDVWRYLGDLDAAASHYEQAEELFVTLGSDSIVFPQYNKALILLDQGLIPEARAKLDRALPGFTRAGAHAVVGDCHIALCACDATERKWRSFDRHLATAELILGELKMADEDTARVAETAARRTMAAGDKARATRVYTIAKSQWTTLQRDAKARAVQAVLDILNPG